MKTAAKVFLILSIIEEIILFIAYIFYPIFIYVLNGTPEGIVDTTFKILMIFGLTGYIIGFILSIIRFIVCGVALTKLKTATCKEDIKHISFATLIFGSFIAGLIMLCMKDEHLAEPLFEEY